MDPPNEMNPMDKLLPPEPFRGFYRNKRVWITGHTGFKGSWLSAWLVELGAKVTGYAMDPPSEPAHFDELGLKKRMKDVRSDIRDAGRVRKAMAKARPEIVFHLAAQPIVRSSYDDPMATYQTNVMGTIHVVEAIRHQSGIRAAVIVTSDKCYENVEQQTGYRESDRLGGKDPYSASKAAAEIAFSSYARSFFTHGKTGIATARAGNVIGGGDWAKDRIVPDCIRAWRGKKKPVVRNPRSTRPWQHVLEPISGYLALGAALATGSGVHALAKGFSKVGHPRKNYMPQGEAFNFGPRKDVNETVGSLIHELRKHWPMAREPKIEKNKSKPEAGLLQLDCTKARKLLGWRATLNFAETASFTANWYRSFFENDESTWRLTSNQIRNYVSLARIRKLPWAS